MAAMWTSPLHSPVRNLSLSGKGKGIGLPENRHTDGLFSSKVLKVLDQVRSFSLVVLGCPVVIINLNLAAVSVHETTKETCFAQRFTAVEDILEHRLWLC